MDLLLAEIEEGDDRKAAQVIIEQNKFDVQASGEDSTPLMRAILRDRSNIAELLINLGADVAALQQVDGVEKRPLDYAVELERIAIVGILLRAGCPLTVTSSKCKVIRGLLESEPSYRLCGEEKTEEEVLAGAVEAKDWGEVSRLTCNGASMESFLCTRTVGGVKVSVCAELASLRNCPTVTEIDSRARTLTLQDPAMLAAISFVHEGKRGCLAEHAARQGNVVCLAWCRSVLRSIQPSKTPSPFTWVTRFQHRMEQEDWPEVDLCEVQCLVDQAQRDIARQISTEICEDTEEPLNVFQKLHCADRLVDESPSVFEKAAECLNGAESTPKGPEDLQSYQSLCKAICERVQNNPESKELSEMSEKRRGALSNSIRSVKEYLRSLTSYQDSLGDMKRKVEDLRDRAKRMIPEGDQPDQAVEVMPVYQKFVAQCRKVYEAKTPSPSNCSCTVEAAKYRRQCKSVLAMSGEVEVHSDQLLADILWPIVGRANSLLDQLIRKLKDTEDTQKEYKAALRFMESDDKAWKSARKSCTELRLSVHYLQNANDAQMAAICEAKVARLRGSSSSSQYQSAVEEASAEVTRLEQLVHQQQPTVLEAVHRFPELVYHVKGFSLPYMKHPDNVLVRDVSEFKDRQQRFSNAFGSSRVDLVTDPEDSKQYELRLFPAGTEREALMTVWALSKLDHPNVVRLHGIVLEHTLGSCAPRVWLQLSHHPGGTLNEWLETQRNTKWRGFGLHPNDGWSSSSGDAPSLSDSDPRAAEERSGSSTDGCDDSSTGGSGQCSSSGSGGESKSFFDDGSEEERRERLVLLKNTGVLEGLRKLHKMGIVHSDLHPGCVVLGVDGCAVISDIGKCIFVESKDMPMPDVGGIPLKRVTDQRDREPGFTDPSGTFTPASDVYSVGMMILSGLVGKRAKLLVKRVPECLEGLPKPLASMLEKMLHPKPEGRPSVTDILQHDNAVLRSIRDYASCVRCESLCGRRDDEVAVCRHCADSAVRESSGLKKGEPTSLAEADRYEKAGVDLLVARYVQQFKQFLQAPLPKTKNKMRAIKEDLDKLFNDVCANQQHASMKLRGTAALFALKVREPYCDNPNAYRSIMKRVRMAWSLIPLDGEYENLIGNLDGCNRTETIHFLDILQLGFAFVLQDIVAVNRILKRFATLHQDSPVQMSLLFAYAAFVGRWSLAASLMEKQDFLPVRNPYYRRIVRQYAPGRPDESALSFASFECVEQSVIMRYSSRPALKEKKEGFQLVPVVPKTKYLQRQGAVAIRLPVSGNEFIMLGPFNRLAMNVVGYNEVPSPENKNGKPAFSRTERMVLRRVRKFGGDTYALSPGTSEDGTGEEPSEDGTDEETGSRRASRKSESPDNECKLPNHKAHNADRWMYMPDGVTVRNSGVTPYGSEFFEDGDETDTDEGYEVPREVLVSGDSMDTWDSQKGLTHKKYGVYYFEGEYVVNNLLYTENGVQSSHVVYDYRGTFKRSSSVDLLPGLNEVPRALQLSREGSPIQQSKEPVGQKSSTSQERKSDGGGGHGVITWDPSNAHGIYTIRGPQHVYYIAGKYLEIVSHQSFSEGVLRFDCVMEGENDNSYMVIGLFDSQYSAHWKGTKGKMKALYRDGWRVRSDTCKAMHSEWIRLTGANCSKGPTRVGIVANFGRKTVNFFHGGWRNGKKLSLKEGRSDSVYTDLKGPVKVGVWANKGPSTVSLQDVVHTSN